MSSFEQDGFEIVERLVDDATCDRLTAALGPWAGRRAGRRGVLDVSAVVTFVQSEPVRQLMGSRLGVGAFAMRALVFDKTPEANWSIRWHQDHAIAVCTRREVRGFTGWSTKNGVLHVQAPTAVVGRTIALRLHLDDSDERSGTLRVIPGSHRRRLEAGSIGASSARVEVATLAARRGDAVLIRPSIAHTSSVADEPSHRRVLQVEFADRSLPGGLSWAHRVPVEPASDRLAVYGTLRRGESNHTELAMISGEWTRGTVRGAVVDAGGYPALEPDPEGPAVAVELLTSSELPAHWARLDAFEGESYARVVLPVEARDGPVAANAYVARDFA